MTTINDATTLGIAPEDRGLGSRTSGAYDNRPHYVGVATERKLRGALTESRLRTLREQAGLTQRRLAALTAEIEEEMARTDPKAGARNPRKPGQTVYGVSAFSINRYENGVHSPRPRYLRLIALALSQALGRRVDASDLQVQDAAGLADHLDKIRQARGVSVPTFYTQFGVRTPERAVALHEGRTDWTADELGRVAVLFPQARQLTQDVLVEQARRNHPGLGG